MALHVFQAVLVPVLLSLVPVAEGALTRSWGCLPKPSPLPCCISNIFTAALKILSRMILAVLAEPSSLAQKALGAGVGHCGRDGAVGPRRPSCLLRRVYIKNLLKALYLTFISLLFILGSGSRLSMKLELDLLATLLKQKPGHYHPYLHGWSVLQQGLRAWSWSGETAAPSFTLLMTWSISCR